MQSRPPTSIVVVVASATSLGALSGWDFLRSLTAAGRTGPRVTALVGIFFIGVFVSRLLRRRRDVRLPAVAIALSCAVIFAVMTLMFAVSPAVPDRLMSAAMTGTFTLLPTFIAVPLLRASARTWLSE